MNKSPAFQFYVKDFLTDDKVAVMNLEQIGAYTKLLCYCWNNNGLTNEQEELKEMCGNPENWDKIWKKVGKCFYENNGKLYNKRLDKEREKQKYWKEKSKEGGIKSGKTRREKSKLKGGSFETKGGSKKDEPKGNHSVSSSSSSIAITSSIPKEDTEILNLLSKVKNYPFNKEKDLGFINGLKTDFPDVDVLEKVKQITLNWLNFPLLKKSRPRVQIRKWVSNEHKWQQEGNKSRDVGKSYTKEPQFLSMELLNKIYQIIDRKGGDKGSFYDKAKSAFPIIRTQWELSDKKPETFIRLVEGK